MFLQPFELLFLIFCPRLMLCYLYFFEELPPLGHPDGMAILLFFVAPHGLVGGMLHHNKIGHPQVASFFYLLGTVEVIATMFGGFHSL